MTSSVQVNTSLSAALARLHNTREEREQFEEASNQTVSLLKSKVLALSILCFYYWTMKALIHIRKFCLMVLQEDELLKSIASCKIESAVVKSWINFLEDSWILQSQYNGKKDTETMQVISFTYFSSIHCLVQATFYLHFFHIICFVKVLNLLHFLLPFK